MSLAQIAASDWSLVLGTVLGWLVIIIFTVMTHRKLSRRLTRLQAKLKLLSDEVRDLKIAEDGRMMMEINAQKKTDDHAHSETPQTAAPPVVPVHLTLKAKLERLAEEDRRTHSAYFEKH
jgi:H+/gluconate symporter-like permease